MGKETNITIEVNNIPKPWAEDKISGNEVKELAGVSLQDHDAFKIKKNDKPQPLKDTIGHPVKDGDIFITESRSSGVKQG